MRDDVPQRVDAPVAGAVGDGERAVIEREHESRRVAARRDIALPLGVRRADQQEGREGDEGAAMPVERGQLLLDDQLARLADERAQFGLRGHIVAEPLTRRCFDHLSPHSLLRASTLDARHCSRTGAPLRDGRI
jgi:hypothetical protein